ncbi:unnamed protein product, partial [Dibothriocephalus latus]
MLVRPPMITLNRKAMTGSRGFLRLLSELEVDVSFDDSLFKGKSYVTNCPNLNLLGLDWIEKFGLRDVPLNCILKSAPSTGPSPAKLNQPAAKLISTLQEKF